MRALHKGSFSKDANNWVLHIVSVGDHGVAAAYSDGSVSIFASGLPVNGLQPIKTFQAHDSTIYGMTSVDGQDLLVTCADDKIKIWDLRNGKLEPVQVLTNDKASKYISLTCNHGLLAAGTELQGVDAEVHIWELSTGKLLRKFVDSHHDDVTTVQFHPTNKDFLLSGSTDGYVNVYDLTIEDEEDALHQVINFASIHEASFIAPYRISTLSHMETFALHEFEKDKSEELTSPVLAHEFGDVRTAWDCEYVITVCPGYIACGANSKGQLLVYPFDQLKETVDTKDRILLLGGHGSEVVRAVLVDGDHGIIYTGGEDGCFKIWETPLRLLTPLQFFDHTLALASSLMDIDQASDSDSDKKKKKKKRKSKDQEDGTKKKHSKHKKSHHSKEDKEHKKHKSHKKRKSDVRFKPY